MLPTELIHASAARGERNDCAVKALAVVCAVPYDVVHAALRRAGRRDNCPTPWQVTLNALASLGYGIASVKVAARTVRTLSREPAIQQGRYLVRVRNHLLAITDGMVCDWTRDKRHRLLAVMRVVRTGDSAAIPYVPF